MPERDQIFEDYTARSEPWTPLMLRLTVTGILEQFGAATAPSAPQAPRPLPAPPAAPTAPAGPVSATGDEELPPMTPEQQAQYDRLARGAAAIGLQPGTVSIGSAPPVVAPPTVAASPIVAPPSADDVEDEGQEGE